MVGASTIGPGPWPGPVSVLSVAGVSLSGYGACGCRGGRYARTPGRACRVNYREPSTGYAAEVEWAAADSTSESRELA